MAEFSREEIADMLAAARPDRYDAGSVDWAATVIDEIADGIPAAVAKQRTAEALVRGIEAVATRKTNALMRRVVVDGKLPLDWFELASWPLSVLGERVCLRALTAVDLRTFADDEEQAAEHDFQARLDCVKGARLLADRLDDQGVLLLADLSEAQ